jgi:hypothetical protein
MSVVGKLICKHPELTETILDMFRENKTTEEACQSLFEDKNAKVETVKTLFGADSQAECDQELDILDRKILSILKNRPSSKSGYTIEDIAFELSMNFAYPDIQECLNQLWHEDKIEIKLSKCENHMIRLYK